MGRHIVVWSGGADSTVVLHELAKAAGSVDHPIIALTMGKSAWLHQGQTDGQKRVQEKYLAYAKSIGLHIATEEVTVTQVSSQAIHPKVIQNGQPQLWMSLLFNVLDDGDSVYFGYIRKDDIWHVMDRFKALFNALAFFQEKAAQVFFPLEWATKVEVAEKMRSHGIDRQMVWTCQEPTVLNEECGSCNKCLDLKEAIEKMPPIRSIKPRTTLIPQETESSQSGAKWVSTPPPSPDDSDKVKALVVEK